MKILSGQARGRILKTPPRKNFVRPILARIKKSLFDILRPRMAGSNFLDLYAGTGSVGLEALSQGASRAAFVEQDGSCCHIIHQNLEALRFEKQGIVIRQSALGNLSLLSKPFDFIFMGPPYKNDKKIMLALTMPTILNVEKHALLSSEGILVAQHHKKESVEPPSSHWSLFRREHYGDSVLSFFKWQT